jgi:hypothetical protein
VTGTGIAGMAVFIFLNFWIFHPAYRIYPKFVKNIFEKFEQGDTAVKDHLLFRTVTHDREYVAAWKDVQTWCKYNTPDTNLILTPYYLRGFRSFSERGIVFQFRDSQLQVYQHFLQEDIIERTDTIGSPLTRYDNPTEYQIALERLYKSYSIEEIVNLAKLFNISYIVTEHDHILDLPLKFRNDYFSVFYLESADYLNDGGTN